MFVGEHGLVYYNQYTYQFEDYYVNKYNNKPNLHWPLVEAISREWLWGLTNIASNNICIIHLTTLSVT